MSGSERFNVTITEMWWLEWDEYHILEKYCPGIKLTDGKHETKHNTKEQQFMVSWEGLKELAKAFDVSFYNDGVFKIKDRGV